RPTLDQRGDGEDPCQQHLFQGRAARPRPGGRLRGASRSGRLMDFQEVVRRRRMVRSFEPRPLPTDVVERILRNAQRAPSAGFSQGWAFLALEGPEQTHRYWSAVGPRDAAAFRWQDLFAAPLLIVCLADKRAYLERYAEPDKGWTDRDEARWAA